MQPSLVALWRAADAELASLLAGGPMTRVSVPLFRRNIAIAIGNAAGAVPPDLLDDGGKVEEERASLAHAAVAEAIAWARERLRGV